MIRVSELKLPIEGNQKALEKKLAKALRVPVEEIKAYRIFKRSLDARKKDNIHYAYVVDVEVKNEKKILEKSKDKMNKQEKTIAILLGLCLAGWLWYSVTEQKKAAEAAREAMNSGFAHEYQPIAENVKVYDELYKDYLAFGQFVESQVK